jgi:dienelactone hydrolase
MPAVTRRRAVFVVIAVVAMVAAWFVALPYVHGLSFAVRAADLQGTARRLADMDARAIEERDATIPTPRGPMRARVYRPVRSTRQSALLVPGPHPFGIDEAGFVRLARALAASSVAIVTPDIPELSRFELTAAIPDAIEQAALWLASESGLAADRHIALIGISFSGGLSIVAAARPSIASRVESVVAIGGHDDLPRVLRFLCTGSEPYPSHQLGGGASQPFVRQPNDLGVAMILIGVAARVVPRAQVEPLRDAVRRSVTASALDAGGDKDLAANHVLALRQLAKRMPEPSATLLRYVNDRDMVHLGARLLPYVSMYGGDPSLSVSKSPRPVAPIFLLHDTDDSFIPSIESEYLAEDLRGHARVRLLLRGMPRSGADRATRLSDVVPLAGFWGDLLFR